MRIRYGTDLGRLLFSLRERENQIPTARARISCFGKVLVRLQDQECEL
jgi:hypothetical protein